MRVSVLPSPWDEFSVASRAYPGDKRGHKMLCFVGRGDINITDRSAATWHPATGNGVRGSGHFYHSSNHIRICGLKEAVFNNAEQLSEPFFDQEELIPKNFGPCLQGQAHDQAQLQILHKFAFEYSRDTPLIEMLLMTLKRS